MGLSYQPGIWAKRFSNLPRHQRQEINEATNQLFYERTNVHRKLDPENDQQLCIVWLKCREEIMARRASMAGIRKPTRGMSRTISRVSDRMVEIVSEGVEAAYDLAIHDHLMPWMNVARKQETLGIVEKAGAGTEPEVMKFLRACDGRYDTQSKANYTEKHGGEKVKWCSAFVNWCFEQIGIVGTDNARALSWTDWGTPLTKPQVGAVVVLKGTSWRHVAFVDFKDGKFVMLGGNQTAASGKGGSNTISYRPYKKSMVVAYRWPSGRQRPNVN